MRAPIRLRDTNRWFYFAFSIRHLQSESTPLSNRQFDKVEVGQDYPSAPSSSSAPSSIVAIAVPARSRAPRTSRPASWT